MKTGTISKAEDPDLREAQNRAIQYWESAHQFRRRTLEEAWKCGQALAVVRNQLSRGEWMPWLDEVGITHDTASRWIRLAARYESSQLADFGSVDQALKALPPARRKRKRPDRGVLEPEKQESPTTDQKPVAETESLPSRDAGADEEAETEDNAPGCLDRESPRPPDDPIEPKPEGLTSAGNPPGRNGQHQTPPGRAPGRADKAETGDAASLPPDDDVSASNGSPMLPAETGIHQLAKEPAEVEVEDGDGHPPVPMETRDAQEIERLRQELRQTKDRLRETEDQLRETKDKLGEAEDRNSQLQEEIDHLRREREEKGPALKPLSFR